MGAIQMQYLMQKICKIAFRDREAPPPESYRNTCVNAPGIWVAPLSRDQYMAFSEIELNYYYLSLTATGF
jgi:hypothetical protein